ncbi:MAG: fasciclin domain-containing protein [Bacteroidales bacterium]
MKSRSLLLLFSSLFLVFLVSCEKETALEKYYNKPGNSSGSIYMALDSSGVHNILVRAIDSTYYSNRLSNTLVTIIAPSDRAFEAYFQKHGYSGLADVPKRKLEDLIGHHIFNWPQSPSVFTGDPRVFKRQTSMAQDTGSKYDIVSNSMINVVKEAKYLQFYSAEILSFYKGNADDYKLLTGTDLSPATGFGIYDVPVDSIVPYGNGWIYYVDKVVEPVQNLDDWLAGNKDYSMFNDMYNRFNIFTRDGLVNKGIPMNIPVKRSSLLKNQRHYQIDLELNFETVGNDAGLNDRKIYPKAHSNFSIVVPQNNALVSFIDNTFTNYPGFRDSLSVISPSLENLHLKLIIRQIISPLLLREQILFPSQLFAGTVTGNDGTIIQATPEDIAEMNLCSNGNAYGLTTYVVPRTFKSILKPVYTTPSYKTITAIVDYLEVNAFLNSKDADYTLFLPTDEAFLKNNILLLTYQDAAANFSVGSLSNNRGENDYIFYNADTTGGNKPAVVERFQLFKWIFNHLFVTPVNPSSEIQFLVSSDGNYVGITADSVWSGGNKIGRLNSRTATPKIVEDLSDMADNGSVYVIDDLILTPKYTFGRLIAENPDFSRFKELCEDAGLYENGVLQVFGEFPTAFIPTNAALNQFISEGKLPSNEADLQSFIMYFFVNRTIFTNGTINESVGTLSKDEQKSTEFKIVYREAEFSGTYGNLRIKGLNNSAFIDVTEKRDIICNDGIVHQINGVLY